MKRMENIFDLSKTAAKSRRAIISIESESRKFNCKTEKKCSYTMDMSGPYTEENDTIDIQRGIRKVRENWTRERFDKQNFHTQSWVRAARNRHP